MAFYDKSFTELPELKSCGMPAREEPPWGDAFWREILSMQKRILELHQRLEALEKEKGCI